MSNPTTPFGWQMPENTDLVTDLPADFEVFGQAVATSMADLLGGASGYVLSKASATDMDFAWIANDVGDITGVTATSPITGGGTSGTISIGIQDALTTQKGAVQLSDSTSTTSSILAATPTAVKSAYDLANGAIPKTLTTTTGDTIYASGANTPARLGIGSTGQVLTVAAGLPSWATPSSGGMTLISTTTLSGATTTLSSIAQTFNSLFIIVFGMTGNTTNNRLFCLPNNVSNLADYCNIDNGTSGTSGSGEIRLIETTHLRTNASNAWALTIDNYTSTTGFKPINFNGFYVNASSANNPIFGAGAFRSNTAITSLVFTYGGTNTFIGGTVLLYGVK